MTLEQENARSRLASRLAQFAENPAGHWVWKPSDIEAVSRLLAANSPTEADTSLQKVQTTPPDREAVAWRYPVLTARDEAVARMARAMRNRKAWPAVFQANTAEALAEDALAALEALAVIPTEGLGSSSPKSEDTHRDTSGSSSSNERAA